MVLGGGGCGRRHVEQCGGVPSAERIFMRVLSHELFFLGVWWVARSLLRVLGYDVQVVYVVIPPSLLYRDESLCMNCCFSAPVLAVYARFSPRNVYDLVANLESQV